MFLLFLPNFHFIAIGTHIIFEFAGVAELVDARDSKSRDGNIMSVRFRPPVFLEEILVNESCIFCKIISVQLPASIVAQTEDMIVIKDLHPKAPIHYLIIPKKHIENIQALKPEDKPLMADMIFMAQRLSSENLQAQNFKLLSNNGRDAGQHVFHLHLHFLAGMHFDF
jgi:histidine triad (HIT) family protein